ncbi:MAG: stage II sporulation protein M [Bacillota bacterium]
MIIPFVQERRNRWERLFSLLKKSEKAQMTSFTPGEILEFAALYRQASADLASAQAQKLPADVVGFLNDLTARAYHQIYRTEKFSTHSIKHLILSEFPALCRANWRIITFTFLIMLAGWCLGFFGYLAGPETVAGFLPGGYVEIIDRYKSGTWFNEPMTARPFISSYIMIHNVQVALYAFAGGMTLGIYTCYIIIFNGFFLGALSALFMQKKLLLSFWAMILPHGVIELSAIVLAGAAGFMLTRAFLFPGEYSRQDALKLYGPRAVRFILGTAFLLAIAALIEGFLSTISTKIIPEYARLSFAGLTGILLFLYIGSRKPRHAGQ